MSTWRFLHLDFPQIFPLGPFSLILELIYPQKLKGFYLRKLSVFEEALPAVLSSISDMKLWL